jgi:hypothetical protein
MVRHRRHRPQRDFPQPRSFCDGRSRIHDVARKSTINGPAAGIFRRRTPPRGHARDHPFLLPPRLLRFEQPSMPRRIFVANPAHASMSQIG